MRLYEFTLTEKISLSHYEEEVKSVIKKYVLYQLKNAFTDLPEKYKAAYDEAYNIEDEDTQSMYVNYLSKELYELLCLGGVSEGLQLPLSEIASKISGEKTWVSFSDDLESKTNGEVKYWSDDRAITIDINNRVGKELAYAIVQSLFYTNTTEYEKLLKSNSDEIFYYAENIIDKFTGIMIHELVHVKQLQPQAKKNKTKMDDRSYIKKGNQSQIYLAQPTEIAAFAHNCALKIVNDIVKKGKSINAEIIASYVDKLIDGHLDKNDPKQYEVYKRYYKLTYQEVMDYINKQKD